MEHNYFRTPNLPQKLRVLSYCYILEKKKRETYACIALNGTLVNLLYYTYIHWDVRYSFEVFI